MDDNNDYRMHSIKVWPQYLKAIRDGKKTWEFRWNDRDYRVGDILELKEWDESSREYTGEVELVVVTYLLEMDDWIPGYVTMSIEWLEQNPKEVE